MQALITTAWSVFILLGIAATGFIMTARKVIPAESLKYFSTLALEIALPFFIFTNLVEKFDPAASPDWWNLPLWWVAFAAVTLLLSMLFGLLFKKDMRREASVSLYLYNPTFVPLSIIIGVYGSDSPYIADLFLFTMFTAMFYFNFYKFFFRKSNKLSFPTKNSFDLKKLFNPLIRVTLLALLLRLTGLSGYIPEAIFTITGYVGSMAFPLIMFLLGAYVCLDIKNSGKIYYAEIIKYTAIKNIVFPLIAIGIIYIIRPEQNVALLLLLSAAAPPITSVPVLIGRKNGNTSVANQFLVASFLFSIISIPAVMALYNLVMQL